MKINTVRTLVSVPCSCYFVYKKKQVGKQLAAIMGDTLLFITCLSKHRSLPKKAYLGAACEHWHTICKIQTTTDIWSGPVSWKDHCRCGFCTAGGTLDTMAEIPRESSHWRTHSWTEAYQQGKKMQHSLSTFENHQWLHSWKCGIHSLPFRTRSWKWTLIWLSFSTNKLANGEDSIKAWAVRTDSLWKCSYSSNRDTCSEGAQTVEYQILYAFLADVGYTEGYSEPYVGPCHLLNLDMTAIKLVWKYTKRNSNFRRETPSAFVTTTRSHRKLLFYFVKYIAFLYKSMLRLNSST